MLFFPKTKNFFSQNDSVHCELNSICTFPSNFYSCSERLCEGRGLTKECVNLLEAPPPSSFVVAGTFSQHQSPCRQYWELLYCGFSYRQTATT